MSQDISCFVSRCNAYFAYFTRLKLVYIICFTIFTMFYSISQNILSNYFEKYCTLISLKLQHCKNFGLLPALLAQRSPTATMLNAASLGQS